MKRYWFTLMDADYNDLGTAIPDGSSCCACKFFLTFFMALLAEIPPKMLPTAPSAPPAMLPNSPMINRFEFQKL